MCIFIILLVFNAFQAVLLNTNVCITVLILDVFKYLL